MIVFSGFDGMSCGQIALDRLGIHVDKYYASEVDKFAVQVTQDNYPDTIQLGDINNWREWDIDWSSIDLVLAGSPCQGFSFAGKQLAFNDPRSRLFFVWHEILCHIHDQNPNVIYLLENVRMKKEYQDILSEYMGVEPVMINSALLSAQRRVRYYWTNIGEIQQPEDKGVYLKDILEDGVESLGVIKNRGEWQERNEKSMCLDANYFKGPDNHGQRTMIAKLYLNEDQIEYAKNSHKGKTWKSGNKMGNMKFPNDPEKKSKCLTAVQVTGNRAVNHIADEIGIRKLTPVECERLQTVHDNYTAAVSNTQRYKMLGNGWTVDVICHIIKSLQAENEIDEPALF